MIFIHPIGLNSYNLFGYSSKQSNNLTYSVFFITLEIFTLLVVKFDMQTSTCY